MKRCISTAAILVICVAPLRADLTIVQTMNLEGGFAAMMGGIKPPTMTTRLKGAKARTDIDMMDQKITTIVDVTAKQVTMLNAATKTANVITAGEMPGLPAGAPTPKIDVSFKPTGQTRTIDGVSCDDYALDMTLSLAEMTGAQMPPEAAAQLKDVTIVLAGTSCIAKNAPGAAEYVAFQRTAAANALDWVLKGGVPGQQIQGMDKVLAALSSAEGLPYLTELTLSFQGTGPMVDMMKQMGAMKMTQKVTSVSTDAIADDMFIVPADYKVEKK